jgi:hypothetical protein
MTSDAKPDRPATENLFTLIELNEANDLVGQKIHVVGKRATAAAGPAMPAKANPLPCQVVDNSFEPIRLFFWIDGGAAEMIFVERPICFHERLPCVKL